MPDNHKENLKSNSSQVPPEPEARIIRREVGNSSRGINIGNGMVDIHAATIEGDLKAFLQLKPRNSKLTDGEWLLMVASSGIPKSLNRDFREYRIQRGQERRERGTSIKSETESPDEFWSVVFGQAGEEAYGSVPITNRDYKSVARALIERSATSLGKWGGDFGAWMQAGGIDEKYIPEILTEFLEI